MDVNIGICKYFKDEIKCTVLENPCYSGVCTYVCVLILVFKTSHKNTFPLFQSHLCFPLKSKFYKDE